MKEQKDKERQDRIKEKEHGLQLRMAEIKIRANHRDGAEENDINGAMTVTVTSSVKMKSIEPVGGGRVNVRYHSL